MATLTEFEKRSIGNRRHCRQAGLRKNNRSGYKGVSKHGNGWQAWIGVGGNAPLYLGHFEYPEQAAEAYDRAARKHFGEDARTNADLGLLV